jgi:hypothetical protein
METALQDEIRQRSLTYKMPCVDVGTRIWFFNNCEDDPIAADVAKLNSRNVDIGIIHRNARMYEPRMAVRHKDDPELLRQVNRQNGCWDYHPTTLVFYERRTERRTKEAREAAEAEAVAKG